MESESKIVTEKLISKISHDFSGTVGALSNALEFIFEVEEVDMDEGTKEMLSSGVEKLSGYLQLLRIALGVDFNHDAVPVDKLRRVLSNLGDYYNADVIFDKQISSYYSTKATRILCLWLLIILSFITKGTTLKIGQTEQGYRVEYQGKLYSKAQEYLDLINKKFPLKDINSDNIFIYQLKYMTSYYEMTINVDSDHESYFIVTI